MPNTPGKFPRSKVVTPHSYSSEELSSTCSQDNGNEHQEILKPETKITHIQSHERVGRSVQPEDLPMVSANGTPIMSHPRTPKAKEHDATDKKRRKIDVQHRRDGQNQALDISRDIKFSKSNARERKSRDANTALAYAVIRSESHKNIHHMQPVSPLYPDAHQNDMHQVMSAQTSSQNPHEAKQNKLLSPSPLHIRDRNPGNEPSPRRRLVDALSPMDCSGRAALVKSETDGHIETSSLAQDTSRNSMLLSPIQNNYSQTSPSSRSVIDTTFKSSVPAPHRLGPSRTTYARQRSFLNDLHVMGSPQSQDTPSLSANHHNRGPSQLAPENYSNIPSQLSDHAGENGPVRSIHELRQAGENSRFQNVIDSIFEDIEDASNSGSARCTTFIQLCEKLMDPHFVRRFRENDSHERLLTCMTGGLDSSSASFALCACEMSRFCDVVSQTLLARHWSNVLNLSSILLHAESDLSLPLTNLSPDLSRPVQQSVRNIQSCLSSIISGGQSPLEISPRLVALFSIYSSLMKFRERPGDIEPMPTSLLKGLVGLLFHKKAMSMGPPLAPEEFKTLVLTLSILEAYAIVSKPDELDQNHSSLRLLSQLHYFLRCGQCDQAIQLRDRYIRVILNLTNRDTYLSNQFSTHELIKSLVEIAVSRIADSYEDILLDPEDSLSRSVLALGVLINLTEKSELARSLILSSTSGSPSHIKLLLQTFFDKVYSVSDIKQDVAIGYLSILLLTLCLSGEAAILVRGSEQGKGLTVILSTANDFLQYLQKIKILSKTPEEERTFGFVTRLKHIIYQVKHTAL